MSSSSIPLALDHIIILLPAKSLDSLPKSFADAFTITPGGTHADGKTYNKLVILQSGVYLEFIAFVEDSPERKQGHWWGHKQAGSIIDWALTSNDVRDAEQLREFYDEPRKGGRKREDGKSVEWHVTFPKQGTERGSVPFFCHDVTPRHLRVPGEGARHPSGALSVDKLVVVVAKDTVGELASAYEKIFGPPVDEQGRAWRVKEPAPDGRTGKKADGGPVIELKEAENEEDAGIVERNGGIAGVREISLSCGTEGQMGRGEKVIEEVFGDSKTRIKLRFADG